jgi:iron uptake system component EfeO
VAPVTAPGGTLAFTVTNDGSAETEFYLYGADGTEIISEVEDIGPGLSRTMTLKADPGTYITACKPGMVGDGIRATFTVTDRG